MKQQAFADYGNEKMLKGGLHCHTTRSDGSGTPEDVIRLHKQHDYDFLAITDHRNYNYKNYAPETGITIIPGMEFDSTFSYGSGFRCFHTVCIGPAKENGNGYDQDQLFESGRSTCQEEYQPYLDDIHANGNMTIYCHPEWSSTPARYFEKLQGNFAMEVWNSGCVRADRMDMDAAYWDELLGQGIKIYGVATDDGHGMGDHCNGWVMVNAKNDIDSILEALREGRFYSSTGPVISDFSVNEEGVVHIECSNVKYIKLSCDRHPAVVRRSEHDDLTSADIKIGAGWDGKWNYVRATVYTEDGMRAWTNPIWMD